MTMFANLVFGWPFIMPFALRSGCKSMAAHWHKVLFIAVLHGFEKNLTNSALFTIGAALKTALHGFNVIFVFFIAAFMGADEPTRWCIVGCRWRGRVILALSIMVVASGSFVAAAFSNCDARHDTCWQGGIEGMILQLSSGLCYAIKLTCIKLLLGDREDSQFYADENAKPPSKYQISFVADITTGLISLAFLPVFEKTWVLPDMRLALALGASVTGIFMMQLRITELTSPLTVAVLGVFHDLAIVGFTLNYYNDDHHEHWTSAQAYGYSVSIVGVLMYACTSLGNRRQHARSGDSGRPASNDSLHSSVEQDYEVASAATNSLRRSITACSGGINHLPPALARTQTY